MQVTMWHTQCVDLAMKILGRFAFGLDGVVVVILLPVQEGVRWVEVDLIAELWRTMERLYRGVPQ